MGMVVMLGDFNAHLGLLAGDRGQGDPNTRDSCGGDLEEM